MQRDHAMVHFSLCFWQSPRSMQWCIFLCVSCWITEVWHIAHFWVSYGRCAMPGSPIGRSEGFSRRWAG